jgi:hypothetical protein
MPRQLSAIFFAACLKLSPSCVPTTVPSVRRQDIVSAIVTQPLNIVVLGEQPSMVAASAYQMGNRLLPLMAKGSRQPSMCGLLHKHRPQSRQLLPCPLLIPHHTLLSVYRSYPPLPTLKTWPRPTLSKSWKCRGTTLTRTRMTLTRTRTTPKTSSKSLPPKSEGGMLWLDLGRVPTRVQR